MIGVFGEVGIIGIFGVGVEYLGLVHEGLHAWPLAYDGETHSQICTCEGVTLHPRARTQLRGGQKFPKVLVHNARSISRPCAHEGGRHVGQVARTVGRLEEGTPVVLLTLRRHLRLRLL